MTSSVIEPSFATGEISPSLFGRTDLARLHTAAATMRNMWVSYRGGSYSRAGTAFVGISKQTGRSYPPRLIPFQFSIKQGLVLEFGHHYMRVVSNGAHVTEAPIGIQVITNGNPAVVGISSTGIISATPNIGGVTSTYGTGDQITLAGGTFATRATLNVLTASLLSASVFNPGQGYVPGDYVSALGGTATTEAVIQITQTQVIGAAVAIAGTGGTNGNQIVTGTTGTGTRFQAKVSISGGSITAVRSFAVQGAYTANPSNINNEPVTGAGLVGAQLKLVMGALVANVTAAGAYTATPKTNSLSQDTTTGTGTGVTFGSTIFAPLTVSVKNPGNYSVYPASPAAQANTNGTGRGATFNIVTGTAAPLAAGDWIYLSGIVGMTELNGRTFVVANPTTNTIELNDVYGNTIDATGYKPYQSGGTGARIYTLPTQWEESDLPWLKFIQSQNTMTLCCVNQDTGTEYPPMDLARNADNDWSFSGSTTIVSLPSPNLITVMNTAVGEADDSGSATPGDSSTDANYMYTVTAVAKGTGIESGAVAVGVLNNTVDIGAQAGSVVVTWNAVPNVAQYNVYKATVSYYTPVSVGALLGYVGTSFSTSFTDTNTIPDFTQTPPVNNDPFGRNAPQNVTINSPTSIYFNPPSGTYPGVCSYYQQRRVFGYTLNQPDTYWMSKPGNYTDFDSRIPSTPTDAFVGTPWSMQVNGIQFMVPMPGGLVVLTGVAAWQVTGAGGSSLSPQSITASNQQAQPQAYNGCSAKVPPIKIDYDIIYVQAKGSIYRDLAYQFITNVYTGSDLTQNSPHLFESYQIVEHAWCEEPFKILWAVRSDGILLSMTYLKADQVMGWARHDTLGNFKSVCSVIEPPVDALYVCVDRTIGANDTYFIERMDDRFWKTVEDCWCVDCGATLGQPNPPGYIGSTSATGLGAITGVSGLIGGSNYSSGTVATIIDENGGPGTGAQVGLAIVNGVITGVFPQALGSGYLYPRLEFNDPSNAGSGASANLILDNSAHFFTTSDAFTAASKGQVIRMGHGIATVTQYVDARNVIANISVPITDIMPNSGGIPRPQPQGQWTLTKPILRVVGLGHLIGMTVTGLADGNVISPRVVAPDGSVTLDTPASSVTIGLGFQAQFQSPYLDSGEPTVQGARKNIESVTVRVEASRGIKIGANQIDGSTANPPVLAPVWSQLESFEDMTPPFFNSSTNPLYTGDINGPVWSGFKKPGQVALQQDNPLPMQILAVIPDILAGDTPEQTARDRNKK